MTQVEKAKLFASLHATGSPLILYNVWDAGSAKAVLGAGAKAIATSSWAVAEAQGYRDGEIIPLAEVERVAARIAAVVDAPLTVDFEGGYAEDEDELAANVSRLVALGAVGINFEDRVVQGPGLYPIDRQARRIAAIREAADNLGLPLFINARTDLFLGRGPDPEVAIGEALDRAEAYREAGASGFFVPGLRDERLIGRAVEGAGLPVNVLTGEGVPAQRRLAELGVARLSHGSSPYVQATATLTEAARYAFF
ncbi:2-Methylisocitrate lyase, PEP mutase family [Methylobacterium sp. UNC378MF]|uniref:Isocitrate lyase/phosphoenolpyruvate mutase family protein n=1 Tax=Methylobacterium oryzae TaxID=334852 RepID=A0ABU7TLW4_9HYPH|nr:isocitrate lyase/phosphoenolpyruvate mutase family protein [Methylobacterium sp. UNC378MF]SDA17434.1 2-Methylisocitrate lyase, PEP mutase family [Methylobacterium sp. UNC378MF]